MPPSVHEKDLLRELVRALENKNSALGTYFRSLSAEDMKDLFRKESSSFLSRGMHALSHLEDYEICAVFRDILNERRMTAHEYTRLNETTMITKD